MYDATASYRIEGILKGRYIIVLRLLLYKGTLLQIQARGSHLAFGRLYELAYQQNIFSLERKSEGGRTDTRQKVSDGHKADSIRQTQGRTLQTDIQQRYKEKDLALQLVGGKSVLSCRLARDIQYVTPVRYSRPYYKGRPGKVSRNSIRTAGRGL